MAMGAERGGAGGSDVGRGGGASGGYGGGGGGGGALGAAVRAANTGIGIGRSALSGVGRAMPASVGIPGQPQMDPATRARIANIQRNVMHSFQGQMDDAENVGDPMGQLGAGLAGMIGLRERAPQPGDVFDGSTYDTDPRASWTFDPVQLGASLIGTATGVPGMSWLGGKLSNWVGNPGSVALGKDVFGPTDQPSTRVASAPEVDDPEPTEDPRAAARSRGMRMAGLSMMMGGRQRYADGGSIDLYTLGRTGGGRNGGGSSYRPVSDDQLMALLQRFGLNPTMPAPPEARPNLWQPAPGRADGGTATHQGVVADILARSRPGQFLQGPGNGRSDSIDARVADGEYIVPADVVSAIGNGSSAAGARALGTMIGKTRSNYRSHLKSLPQPKK